MSAIVCKLLCSFYAAGCNVLLCGVLRLEQLPQRLSNDGAHVFGEAGDVHLQNDLILG